MRIRIAGSLHTVDYIRFVFASRASELYATSASRACAILIRVGAHHWMGKSILWSSTTVRASHENVKAMCDIVNLIESNIELVNIDFKRTIEVLAAKIGEEESRAFHKKMLSLKWFEVLFSYNVAKESHNLLAEKCF